MSAPNSELMAIYGTTKEAGDIATAARIAAAVLGLSLMRGDLDHVATKRMKHKEDTNAARAREAAKMQGAVDSLKMAEAAGTMMAKVGIASLIGKASGKVVGALTPGWKTKALATGGTLGAGIAGYKGLSAMRDYANKPKGDQTWGSKRPLAQGVSEWGYPVY